MQLWGRDPLGGSLISDEPACLLLSPRLSQGESRCPWSLRPSDPPSFLFSGITPSHSSLGWEACGGGGETTHAHSTFCLALSEWTAGMAVTLQRFPDAARMWGGEVYTLLWGVVPEVQGQLGVEVFMLCPTALCSDISGPSGAPVPSPCTWDGAMFPSSSHHQTFCTFPGGKSQLGAGHFTSACLASTTHGLGGRGYTVFQKSS